MGCDDHLLQEISERANLADYVSQSYSLIRKGDDLFTNCPLHIDRTPSLSITPEKNVFYCHSCGVGGSLIQWLMKIENMPYDEALTKAIRIADLDQGSLCQSRTVALNRQIEKWSKRKDETSTRVFLDESAYSKYEKSPVHEWIDEGIKQEEIDLFEIRIDNAANRIVYPVRDEQGRLIGVKGRTRFENWKQLGIAKYMNYYRIQPIDFFQGLNITLSDVKATNEIIIVEGIKSVMKLHGHGVKNVAAAEKHTLTREQIELLIKIGADVTLAFDTDVTYNEQDLRESINLLKRFTNVFLVKDTKCLLGAASEKNSPIDKGFEKWKQLYAERKRVK